MPAAFPSLRLRSLRKHIATLAWKSGTPFIRNTVWRDTRAMGLPTISKPCASTAPRLFTAIPSRPYANRPAGPLAQRKLHFLLRFDFPSGNVSRRLFSPCKASHSERARLAELFLHSRQALPRGLFFRACASPVRF